MRLADHPVHPEREQVVRVPVVRANADALGVRAEFGDGADRLRQAVPRGRRRAAAQENPHARFEQVVGDVAVNGLVRVGHAAGRIRRDELPPVDVPAHRPPARERRREDRVAALVAVRHLHEIHLFPQRDRFRPAVEQRADLRPPSGRRPPFPARARWPGTVLGTVRKMDSGACRASSSIISMPAASSTLPISWLSQKMVVVPLSNAASAYAQAVIMLLSMWRCGSTSPGAMMPPLRVVKTHAVRAFARPRRACTAAMRPPLIQISRSGRMRSE